MFSLEEGTPVVARGDWYILRPTGVAALWVADTLIFVTLSSRGYLPIA